MFWEILGLMTFFAVVGTIGFCLKAAREASQAAALYRRRAQEAEDQRLELEKAAQMVRKAVALDAAWFEKGWEARDCRG